jgi:hypothetical protein
MANDTDLVPGGDDLIISGDAGALVSTSRPKSLADELTGTEDIGANDVRLPRLAIAQGLSNEMIPGDARYIPDLKLFDFFNDLSGEIYGQGPITFIPVRRDVRRIEFVPRNEGGGIVDMDVPLGDKRLAWTRDPVSGDKRPPIATKFTEFVILMLRSGKRPEPIMLSIKDTNKFNRRASDQLTTFIKLRGAAIYAGLYSIASKPEKNDKGTFGTPVVKNAGFINVDTPLGKKLYDHAAHFAASLDGKNLVVNRDTTDDSDSASFDTAAMDAEAAQNADTPQM